MKAIICTQYGPPEVLKIHDIAKPLPKTDEILIKVKASAVNSADVRVRGLKVSGFMKVVMRLVLGINKPRRAVLGTVFSGIVESTGAKVKRLKVGDEVFGMTGLKFGAYAEYCVVNEKSKVIEKPKNASFEEAAALPFGGQTAIYFFDKAKISEKKNPEILIVGATGSVGTAAIQIAQQYTAKITAVCSSRGLDLVKSLGVSNIVQYDREGLDSIQAKFDIVFDAVGKASKASCKKLLKKGGIFKTVEGMDVARETKGQLELLKRLFEENKFKATIDKVYTIDQVVEAHAYVDTGRKKGNVILQISSL